MIPWASLPHASWDQVRGSFNFNFGRDFDSHFPALSFSPSSFRRFPPPTSPLTTLDFVFCWAFEWYHGPVMPHASWDQVRGSFNFNSWFCFPLSCALILSLIFPSFSSTDSSLAFTELFTLSFYFPPFFTIDISFYTLAIYFTLSRISSISARLAWANTPVSVPALRWALSFFILFYSEWVSRKRPLLIYSFFC